MSATPTAIENTNSAQEELLVRQQDNGVAVVQLNRPQATNALSLSLQAALSTTFTALSADASVRCIVLTGGDKVFAAGGDIRSMDSCGPIEIIMPGIGGTQRLVRAVGKFQAMRILLTGKPVSADEACAMGLVSLVCADDQVIPEALKMAKLIAAMPPLAVEQIKEVVIAGMDASLDAALMLERKANQILFATRDQKEGMHAFIEKRQPQFKGE